MTRLIGAAILAAISPAALHAADDEWSWRLTPYFWAPSMTTDVGIGADPPVSSDVALLDVLEGAFLGTAEARKGDWGILAEFNYLDLAQDASGPGGLVTANVGLEGIMASLMISRRVYASDTSSVELVVGARYWSLDTSVNFKLAGKASNSNSWADPLIGIRASHDFTPKIFADGQVDIGGFGFGSDLQWEALARVGYRFTDTVSAAVGYRHLDLDFDDDGLVLNMTLSGPFMAIDFNF